MARDGDWSFWRWHEKRESKWKAYNLVRRSAIGCGIRKHQDDHWKNQVSMMLQEVLMYVGMHIGENNADNKCKSAFNCSTIDEPTSINSKNPRSYPRSKQIGAFCLWSIRPWFDDERGRAVSAKKIRSLATFWRIVSETDRCSSLRAAKSFWRATMSQKSQVTEISKILTRDMRQQTWPQLSNIVKRDNWCTRCIIWTCR